MAAEAPPARPAQPHTNNPQETSMDIWWTKVDGATAYIVQVKGITEDWKDARELEYGPDSTRQTVEGLMPTNTYEFRLIVETAGGRSPPSESEVADTLVANCGPKKDSCVIQ